MGKAKKIIVRNMPVLFNVLLLLNLIFVVMLMIYTVCSPPPHYVMWIVTSVLVFLPSLFIGGWLKLYSVTLENDIFKIRKWNGKCYSFSVSEIVEVKWKTVDSSFVHTERITVCTRKRHFSVDTAMYGFKDLSNYISANIDESIIRKKHKEINNSW